MQISGAPASLMHAAARRALSIEQQELIAHCHTVEGSARQLIRRIDATKEFDPQWLAAARIQLKTGFMQLKCAIAERDFF